MNKYSQAFLSLCSVTILMGLTERAHAKVPFSVVNSGVSSTTELNFVAGNNGSKAFLNDITRSKSVMQRLRDLLRGPSGEGGTHGEFCSVTPNPSSTKFRTTLSSRPLFLWKGTVNRIMVEPRGREATPLWTHTLTDAEKQRGYITYGGAEALSPGRYVYHVIYEIAGTPRPIQINFEVVSDAALQSQLDAVGTIQVGMSTAQQEDVALRRAEILSSEDAFSMNLIQELYAVESASAEWKAELQSFVDETCD